VAFLAQGEISGRGGGQIMEHRVLKFMGTAAQHILHALRRAIWAMALTFLIVGVAAAAATEIVAFFLTGSAPTGPTHLAAAALAVAFGYAAAVTVAISEILFAIVKTIELLVKESEKLAEEAFKEAEVLARKAEGEAVRLGRGALGDAESLGRGVAGVAGGLVGGVVHEAQAVEHGIGSHLPGHHNQASPSAIPAPSNSTTN
jgi:hypothetical protein